MSDEQQAACDNCGKLFELYGEKCPHCGAEYEYNEGNIITTEWWKAEIKRTAAPELIRGEQSE